MTRELQFDNNNLVVCEDLPELGKAAAEFIRQHSEQVLKSQDRYFISLSGGSTPVALFHALTSPGIIETINWPRFEIYFGDERYVSHTHADSNYKMAYEDLLSKVPIQNKQIHAMQTDCENIIDCADKYADEMRLMPQVNGRPAFDLVLLGIGEDGHTASLFPDTDILDERDKNVAGIFVKKFDSWRISVTYPVLDAARQLLVLASGGNKATVLKDIMQGNTNKYPIQGINNPHGLLWYVDRAAIQDLI